MSHVFETFTKSLIFPRLGLVCDWISTTRPQSFLNLTGKKVPFSSLNYIQNKIIARDENHFNPNFSNRLSYFEQQFFTFCFLSIHLSFSLQMLWVCGVAFAKHKKLHVQILSGSCEFNASSKLTLDPHTHKHKWLTHEVRSKLYETE